MDYRERWELKEYLLEQRLGRRVTLFHASVFALLLAYLLGFWYLQGVRGEEYALLAETNRLRRVPLLPTRGVIHDRHGEVIASTRPSLRLIFRREGTHDQDEQLRRLEGVLSMSYESLAERLDQVRGRPEFEPALLKEDVELSELAPVEARREWYPSVEVEEAARRTYPSGEIVAHVLGYVGEVSEKQLQSQGDEGPLRRGDIVGKAGIEKYYDERLRGTRGWEFVTVNNMGRQLGKGREGRGPEDGEGLRLTLDLRLQKALVGALGEEVGAGVFMDPRNGEILAMASTPTFDPNLFAGKITAEAWTAILRDRRRPLHDRAIASYYAPGSTFKVIMAIAGLETGTVGLSDVVTCRGATRIYNQRRLCWKRGGHGTVNLHKALVHSCNIFFYNLGKEMGLDPIQKYASRFQLGRKTGIDVTGEVVGVLPSDEWKRRMRGEPWYPGDTISVAIGQGLLAVTPIQMATMISAVATGSVPKPHLRIDEQPESVPVNVSPGTLSIVRKALAETVKRGTGRSASLGSVTVAGKTGTAQVYKHSAGIDADDLPKEERDHAWFVGYAPVDAPEIAFAVVVEHGGHGGTTAAPVARQVLEVFFAERLRQATRTASRTSTAPTREIARVTTPPTR